MSEPPVGRIFLVGTPRSGTTLYQSIMAAHSQILSLPETHFFLNLIPKRNYIARALGLTNRIGKRQYNELIEWAKQTSNVPIPSHPIFTQQYAVTFLNLLDAVTRQQGKTHWLEKSPEHLRAIDIIKKYVPGAKFLHLVRSGPDTIASLYDMSLKHPEEWGTRWKSLEFCIQFWIDDTRTTLSYLNRPDHLVVTYQDIITPPHLALVRTCEFLSIPFEPGMLEEYANRAEKLTPAQYQWRRGATQSIQNRDGLKFNTIFSEEQRQYILKRVAEVDLSPIGLD